MTDDLKTLAAEHEPLTGIELALYQHFLHLDCPSVVDPAGSGWASMAVEVIRFMRAAGWDDPTAHRRQVLAEAPPCCPEFAATRRAHTEVCPGFDTPEADPAVWATTRRAANQPTTVPTSAAMPFLSTIPMQPTDPEPAALDHLAASLALGEMLHGRTERARGMLAELNRQQLAAVRDAAWRLWEACTAPQDDAQTASAPARIDAAGSAGVGAGTDQGGVESDSGGRDG